MRVKLTIFVLSAFLLWSSLLAVSHHNTVSKHQEIKNSADLVSKTIVSDEDFIWKKSSSQLHLVLPKFAKEKINAGREQLSNVTRFTQQSVKYYLLFRVLRN
jgi:hypothetical protein